MGDIIHLIELKSSGNDSILPVKSAASLPNMAVPSIVRRPSSITSILL